MSERSELTPFNVAVTLKYTVITVFPVIAVFLVITMTFLCCATSHSLIVLYACIRATEYYSYAVTVMFS